MGKLWDRLFLEERPSISMSMFRIVVALNVGLYLIPTFMPLKQNYLSGAFKVHNYNFFLPGFIDLVQKSPDALVVFFVALFCLACFCYLVGLFTQISCFVMTACCYYFYALNSFAMSTLCWDILLVTLFLMCMAPYGGDYFSIDALRRKDPNAYKRKRPYFQQRLLQLQIAFIYFYTALYKVTAQGNWFTGNPLYYLMNYPPQGVVKNFFLKEFLSVRPDLCYALGVTIVLIEFAMPFLLFYKRTRISAIFLGFVFHITLILTLDVPSIFFFLFPPQLLLFIHPDKVIHWIDLKRAHNRTAPAPRMIYDGHCEFCRASVRKLEIMDLFGVVKMVDYQQEGSLETIHPRLNKEAAHSQLHLVDPDDTLHGGFFAFRRCCLIMPMLYALLPVMYFPGAGVVGPIVYRWVAKNRYLFHVNKTCKDNACFR